MDDGEWSKKAAEKPHQALRSRPYNAAHIKRGRGEVNTHVPGRLASSAWALSQLNQVCNVSAASDEPFCTKKDEEACKPADTQTAKL